MMEFTVRPDVGDEFTITAGTRDILTWERTSRGKTFSQLMDNMSMVELYRLAHLAAVRTGQWTGSLQEFEKAVDLEFEETPAGAGGTEGPDPTSPAASTGS